MVKGFDSNFFNYNVKGKKLKKLTEHFENNFNMFIKAAEEPKPLKKGATEEEKKANEMKTKKQISQGSLLNLTATLFPEADFDPIAYLKTLHGYRGEQTSWVSLGFAPKAKDLKTVVEDLN